uniref:Uncharacterized protein n=1 Tax=Strigamia maritima TaxID=126957 RepID=T1ILC6_STRMM
MKKIMKNFIAVCVFTITVAVVYASGPEAVEDKWETCNSIIDNSIAYLHSFIESEKAFETFTDFKKIGPCSKCKTQNLKTIERTGDVPFEKNSTGIYNYTVPIAFDDLKVLCDCTTDGSDAKNTGQFQTVCKKIYFTN